MPGEYQPYRLKLPVSHAEYVRRTKHSAVVFNTPAVHDCLGWKLGEFLALGKAIISTPLGRSMPGDFRHGEQYHMVEDDAEEIREAVELLAANADYRHHLERSARAYWERWLSPTSVIRRLTG